MDKNMPNYLNLGCGLDIRKDWINHDIIKHNKHIHVWNLNNTPWPWGTSTIDRIDAISVFEHLELTLIETLNQCWRILKPGGGLYMKLPAWDSHVSYQDPTHRWFYDPRVFEYFDPATPLGREYWFYTELKWKLKSPGKYNSGKTSIHGSLQKVIDVGS